jgi:DNA-binding PadR family transcriptional regulator
MARARSKSASGAGRRARTLTTTEAAVLALLASEGERSGYDLLKLVGKAIAYMWSPARSHLYAVLPRLVKDGLADVRQVAQERRPDKQLYRITAAGREALDTWLETVEPGNQETFQLKLFVGGLTTDDVLVRHVEQFLEERREFLDELLEIEPTNTRTGHDYYHYFLLRRGIERTELDIRWAEDVLRDLERHH